MRIPETPPQVSFSTAALSNLALMERDPRAQAVLHLLRGKYAHWDKVRVIARHQKLDPASVWLWLRMGRANTRSLPLASASGEPLRYSVPDAVQQELMLIDQQLAGRLRVDGDAPLGSASRERFILNSLMEEAIASSMLEGAATTRRDAKQMLREARKPRTPGERMVANNYATVQFIREHLDRELTPDFIIEIQGMITEGTVDAAEVGRLRRVSEKVEVVDHTEQVLHVPPHASELPARLDRLCAFANAPATESDSFIHPVVRAVMLHFQLAYDHPFCDGNGRTARALFYWSVLRSGYRLFEFLPLSRLIYAGPSKYARAFLHTETDGFDGTYFLYYHVDIIRRARLEFAEYVKRKIAELGQARIFFSNDQSLNRRQQILLVELVRNPDAVFTVEGYQNTQAVSYGTARNDLLHLVRRRYLKRTMDGRRIEFVAGSRIARLAAGDLGSSGEE